MVAAALALALSFGGVLTATASAKPPAKPGAPTDLAVSLTKPAGSYVLSATWNAGSNATSYRVGVTNAAGTSLGGGTVSQPAWSGPIAATVGTTVHVTVTSYNGTRRGGSTSTSKTAPDLTAPSGRYSATWPATTSGPTETVTLTNDGVSDDVSAPAAITVTVDWGDNTATDTTNGAQSTLTHDYAMTTQPTRYVPVITLTDAAGNTSTAPVDAVIVADTTAPAPTATLSRTTAWAAYTKVYLKQTATDNLSPAASITRSVDWGDGTVQVVKGDSTLGHVYRTAGTYAVHVTASDEAQPANTATAQAGSVKVTKDIIKPTVWFQLPAKSVRNEVRGWRVIKGGAADPQTGVRSVRLRLVERRNGAFYAYHPGTRTWVRASTLTAAFNRTTVVPVVPVARHWQMSVRGLVRGRIYLRVTSVDHVGNVSLQRSRQQALTRR